MQKSHFCNFEISINYALIKGYKNRPALFPFPPPGIFYNYNYCSHGLIVMKIEMVIN